MLNRILMLVLLFSTVVGNTQINPVINEERALKMIARSSGEHIALRWAPTSPRTWFHCNDVGYVLVRHTYMRNGELLGFEERSQGKFLTEEPIFPWQTEAEWKPLMERDDYAAIGAQSIFGKSFDIESGTEGEDVSLTNRAASQINRFGFGLFAADQSFDAAKAMGLAFVDTDVRSNEKYVYRIYPAEQSRFSIDTVRNGTTSIPIDYVNTIDTGFVSVSLADVYQLPKILDVKATFGNRHAMVSWDKELFNFFYISYIIERSEDGVTWNSIRDLPYVAADRTNEGSKLAFLTDSLERNNQPYFYRIKGRTPFGEVGPASDPVQGMGIDDLPFYYPSIESVLPNSEGGFNVSWDFNESDNDKIIGFKITRSSNDKGPFLKLTGETLLPASQRFFIDPSPLPANYYLVTAVDQYGREMTSFAALAQLHDDTPPAIPKGLRGTILKNGSTVISWEENTEADFLGYRVYMSNHEETEFTQLTSKPTPNNYFIDTVTLNTLTENVYVKIFAVDFRQNPSAFSELLTLTRPDTIPPTAPVFRDIRSDTSAVALEWANSSSTDVVRHELYRSPVGEENWELLTTIELTDYTPVATFKDRNASVGKPYQYKVVAIDNGELMATSKLVQGRRIDDFIREPVHNLSAQPDRRAKTITLSWNYPVGEETIRTFLIYRLKEEGTLASYESITPEESGYSSGRGKRKRQGFTYTDTSLQLQTTYQYGVKVIYENGAQSPVSELITVDY